MMLGFKEKVPTLARRYKNGKPFPHLSIKHFLKPDYAAALLDALTKEKFYEKESDLFKFLQTHDFKGTQVKELAQFRSYLMSREFVNLMSMVTGLTLKPGNIDLHATWYSDTSFLLPHEDELQGRKVAFMLYLSDLKKKDGGSLDLFAVKRGKARIAQRLIPKANTFTFFEISKNSLHQVSEVIGDAQRIAIAGWFHG